MLTEPREKISFKGYSVFLAMTRQGSDIGLEAMAKAAVVGFYDAALEELDKMDADEIQDKFILVQPKMMAQIEALGVSLGKLTASSE